jgi:hypothetical protein
MATATDEAIKAELIELEQRRCQALEGVDREALAEICDGDLIFVHGNGKIEDKRAHMRDMGPRRTERGELDVRVYGDIALMVGPQTVIYPGREPAHFIATQVWIRRPSGWKLLAFQPGGRLEEQQ